MDWSDWRLKEAIATNDTSAFLSLVQENEEILEEKTAHSSNTVLHAASRLGHVELVAEIVKLRPQMVTAENNKLETPMHVACRRGNHKVLMLLLETNPWVASKLNCENQSALFLACSYGHVDQVNLLLNQRWLLDFQEEDEPKTLHVAVSKGHIDIVRNLIDKCPSFVQKIDEHGFSPLHCAVNRGRLEISTMLLKKDPDLALQYNNSGYTPFHLAALNDKAAILKEFIAIAPTSFQILTKQGETVFHLTVMFSKYDAFLCLARGFKDTTLFHQRDQYGNTVLHAAVTGERYHFAEYIIKETEVQINCRNFMGYTALDILAEHGKTLKSENIRALLNKVGGKRSKELPSKEPKNEQDKFGNQSEDIERPFLISESNNHPVEKVPTLDLGMDSHGQHKHEETPDKKETTYPSNPEICSRKSESSKSNNIHSHKRKSDKQRRELMELYKNRHESQQEMYRKAQLNAMNTITLVAILIATITFTAGLNPPGGVYQDGPLRGKSVLAKTSLFKAFAICNNVALFVSLSIVIVLVSIIPYKRKPLMVMMVGAHKAMLVAVSFTATAYVAATWLVMSRGSGIDWTIEFLVSICAGTLGVVFFGLGVMLIKHHLRKLKRRREKSKLKGVPKKRKAARGIKFEDKKSKLGETVEGKEAAAGIHDEDHSISGLSHKKNIIKIISPPSSNSDIDSSNSGYHTY